MISGWYWRVFCLAGGGGGGGVAVVIYDFRLVQEGA